MEKRLNESGRSMVEMLGVIAIIGVITVGGITSMGYVDSYYRTSATLLEVEQMARDINDMYSWATQFPEDTLTTTLLEEDILESERNRWGGMISVEGHGDHFTISYSGVRRGACERIIEQAPTLKEVALSRPKSINSCTDGVTVEFTSDIPPVTPGS